MERCTFPRVLFVLKGTEIFVALAGLGEKSTKLPPHPFVEAQAAVERCRGVATPTLTSSGRGRPQAFIMMGESGSGKTHTVRRLAQVATSHLRVA